MAAQALSPLLLWERVEESADEAEFLWRLWERALRSETYNLRKVTSFSEDRLLGALDGLRAGGEAAHDRVLFPALASEEPQRICAAACVLAQEASPQGIDALAAHWQGAEGPVLSSLRRGVELVATPALLAELSLRLRGAAPPAQAALLETYAFAGVDPGVLSHQAAVSEDPLLLRAHLRVAARLPQLADEASIRQSLAAKDPLLVEAAMTAGLVVGLPVALSRLRAQLEPLAAAHSPLLSLLASIGDAGDRAKVMALLSRPELCKGAVVALGFCGTKEAADACVELMRSGVVPRLAADSFCTITGLDLHEQKLIEPEPDSEPVPFEQDDLDQDLSLQDEEMLPLPRSAGVIAWWDSHRDEFLAGRRYLAGQPISQAVLWQSLTDGPMRRRPPLALELAIRTQGQWLQTTAFAFAQWRQLQQLLTLPGDALSRSPLRSQLSAL